MMLVDDLLAALEELHPTEQRDAYIRFVTASGDASLRRDGGPEHVTGSCFVLSPDVDRVLLCFHRKGRFWVQFGGHVEPQDASVADAAQREAREESGIADLTLISRAIVDLDRHDLHGGFSCAAHWDIGFVAVASPDVRISVSDESEDVRWFPVDDLPGDVPPGFESRLEKAVRAASSLRR
ncbi:NUDIX hydrolase [Microbacterium sp. ASV49]|uniref:NUDIX domain-containing protein n=1 Tax=Microbacterium candidum TaxID=3041922 RepID=A0ABT7MXR1_9MICO|nr:NUDIX domain-containing protein [Microbacterium sp. ASV49]MDL9979223.1 NUDIX domain-containing protein [Microbacterium sp. ASV49]